MGKATDGVDVVDAETYGWQLFRDHAMVQRLIAPYDLGDRGADAQHWLVVDSSTGKVAIMRPEDAAELLDTQPRTRAALVGGLSPADRAAYLDAVQQTTNAPSGTEAGWLSTWMDYARPIAAAQRELVRDLNFQAGRSLLGRIRGLTPPFSRPFEPASLSVPRIEGALRAKFLPWPMTGLPNSTGADVNQEHLDGHLFHLDFCDGPDHVGRQR